MVKQEEDPGGAGKNQVQSGLSRVDYYLFNIFEIN